MNFILGGPSFETATPSISGQAEELEAGAAGLAEPDPFESS